MLLLGYDQVCPLRRNTRELYTLLPVGTPCLPIHHDQFCPSVRVTAEARVQQIRIRTQPCKHSTSHCNAQVFFITGLNPPNLELELHAVLLPPFAHAFQSTVPVSPAAAERRTGSVSVVAGVAARSQPLLPAPPAPRLLLGLLTSSPLPSRWRPWWRRPTTTTSAGATKIFPVVGMVSSIAIAIVCTDTSPTAILRCKTHCCCC